MATTFGQQFMDRVVSSSGDVSDIIERVTSLPAVSKTLYQEEKVYQLVKVQSGFDMGDYYVCTRSESTGADGSVVYSYSWSKVTDDVVPVLINNGLPAAGGFFYIANNDNRLVLAWADADSQDKPFFRANVYFEANGASRKILSTSTKNACINGVSVSLSPSDLAELGNDFTTCNVELEILYGTEQSSVAVSGPLNRLELTPDGRVVHGKSVNWASTSDILNRPPITFEGNGNEREWTADLDHVKVGDIKKLSTLGSAVTLTTALDRLNKIASIFGASTSAPDGEKTVDFVDANGNPIYPGGSFREAMVGYTDQDKTVPIIVVGGNQDTGSHAGLWWSEDGVVFHQSNVVKGDWEQPQYSNRLRKWVASSSSSANGELSSGIVYSNDGKNWIQSNITGPQPEIEIYEDDSTTLFMCGFRISSLGESWSNANAKYNSTGCGVAAVPVTCETTLASAIVGYTGKCLYIATAAVYSSADSVVESWNPHKWHLMCTLVDVSGSSKVYNASNNIPWYDIDSSIDGEFAIKQDTKFDSVRAMTIEDKNHVIRHVIMAGATTGPRAFYTVAPTGTVTLSDLSTALNGSNDADKVWLWRPCGVPVTGVTGNYETPEYCGEAIVMPTMSTELTGDRLYVINAKDFLEQHDNNQEHTWTHVTVAANDGTIHKGGYYKPEPVTLVIDGEEKTIYVTTGYKFNATMLFSENGLDWYKSEYFVHAKPPFQFGNKLIIPTTDNDGIVYLTTEEFAYTAGLSKKAVKTDTIDLMPGEWTEVELVSKINELVYAVNSMAEIVGRKI